MPTEGAAAARASVPVDPHWYRRAVHAFGSTFIVWYLIPADAHALWWAAKWVLPGALLGLALLLETGRLTGRLPSSVLFGLRTYEAGRIGGYVYFGIAGVLLLYFFPQAIAVPCLVGMALLDPLAGDLRRRGHERWGTPLAVTLATGLFLLSGWALPASIAAAALMTLSETVHIPALDDDLLMALAPALVLLVLTTLGLTALPAPFLHPLGAPGGLPL